MQTQIMLREVIDSDLPHFFDFQRDPEGVRLAAVQSRDSEAFAIHWRKILADPATVLRTIVHEGEVVGHLVSFDITGHREVGYWIGRAYWGRGVASRALADFLTVETRRPLYGHVAKHNVASRRVLEKCGFTLEGEDPDFARAGGAAIGGYVFKLG